MLKIIIIQAGNYFVLQSVCLLNFGAHNIRDDVL
jgi:hypothetical protein